MPIYDYRCDKCGRVVRLRYSFKEYDQAKPVCPHCGSTEMRRRVGRVAVFRSEDSRYDELMSDDTLAGIEDDPRAMGRFIRQMSRQTGEGLNDEMDEVAGRLENGESIESIERSMPDIGELSGHADEI